MQADIKTRADIAQMLLKEMGEQITERSGICRTISDIVHDLQRETDLLRNKGKFAQDYDGEVVEGLGIAVHDDGIDGYTFMQTVKAPSRRALRACIADKFPAFDDTKGYDHDCTGQKFSDGGASVTLNAALGLYVIVYSVRFDV